MALRPEQPPRPPAVMPRRPGFGPPPAPSAPFGPPCPMISGPPCPKIPARVPRPVGRRKIESNLQLALLEARDAGGGNDHAAALDPDADAPSLIDICVLPLESAPSPFLLRHQRPCARRRCLSFECM